jgi:ribosomal protein S12 methylthiotransferase accessory factor
VLQRSPERRRIRDTDTSDLTPFAEDRPRAPATWRTRDVKTVVAIARAIAPQVGVTRVADVTGLDRIGIPVVMVIRPNAFGAAVSQGKGCDLAAATASGLMEAIEAWHAEHLVIERRLASYETLARDAAALDVARLPPRRQSAWRPDLPMWWVEGRDLLGDRPVWVPHQLVHGDYRLPPPPGTSCFCASSNGLAAGSGPQEALLHALCEVIERDAVALWHASPPARRDAARVDLATVNDPVAVELLARLDAADMSVAVWDVTSDVGVPAFRAEIAERGARLPSFHLAPAVGAGCHPSSGVALCRALTEAAQSRLTVISGARDDLDDSAYQADDAQPRIATARTSLPRDPMPLDFRARSSLPEVSIADAVESILRRLCAVGVSQAALVDLSHPDFDVSVVRVVVPGLETSCEHPFYMPGPRARAVMGAARVRPIARRMF